MRADLEYLRSQGWDKDIQRHLRFGGKVMGICGGYQMLGKLIEDPDGVEGEKGNSIGLGLLDTTTLLARDKTLTNTKGELTLNGKTIAVKGYEIHVGQTVVNDQSPIVLSDGIKDGALSDCNQILGTYLHGIFDNSDSMSLICEWAGASDVAEVNHEQLKEEGIDRIADAIEKYLDLGLLWPELIK